MNSAQLLEASIKQGIRPLVPRYMRYTPQATGVQAQLGHGSHQLANMSPSTVRGSSFAFLFWELGFRFVEPVLFRIASTVIVSTIAAATSLGTITTVAAGSTSLVAATAAFVATTTTAALVATATTAKLFYCID